MKRARADNALGQNLRRVRRAHGWSQCEAAQRIGPNVSASYLCQVEKGQVKSPSLTVCMALADAYNLTLNEIAEWQGTPPQDRPTCPACGQELDDGQ